jgi:flavin-dependent dehydrogenase
MAYDCIVVGARCAGSALARFVARAGKRVLVIDSATFPSDQPLSTHFIQPFGMRILDELGLGDRVRDVAPPVTKFWNGCDDAVIELDVPYGGCCPRRTELDAILVEGAREAGAELRFGTRVVDIVRDGERVAGVVVEDDTGRHELRANVVVGADGRASTIADKVGAEEYLGYDNPRAGYWAYWPRPADFATGPLRGGSVLRYFGQSIAVVFPTNRDQLLIGAVFPVAELPDWKSDPTAKLRAWLEANPVTAPFVANTEPLTKTIGMVKLRYFFRRAAGAGWALVGDAGLHKDPTPGLGISDALRDARALGAAIVAAAGSGDGSDALLERYWRERDIASIELFHFAKDMGELAYNNPLNRVVLAKINADPAMQARLVDMLERRISPFAMIPTRKVLAWTFGALVRGNFGVMKPFFAAGKFQGEVKRELKLRRGLARALPAST